MAIPSRRSRTDPTRGAPPEPSCARAAGAANQTQILGDLYRLDPLTLRWTLLGAETVLGSPPPARYGHGLAAVNGSAAAAGGGVYVFGGANSSGGVAEGGKWGGRVWRGVGRWEWARSGLIALPSPVDTLQSWCEVGVSRTGAKP
jgi:hypothetical protein